ncbi:MAG: TetR/AcrR family transcriptional regulator [Sphaerochaeta sp.]|nr:TetR/AcrR family transcriptional regulator [Sphaerochaeta sp.]
MQENRKLTKPTFDNLPTEKRLKIIRTATGEFAKNGYENTSINTIAERASISVGSLYKYFDSKQDLFLYTIAQGTEVLRDVLSSIVPSDLSFEEKVGALIEAIQRTSREQGELIQLYSELTSVGNTELVEKLSYEIEAVSAASYTALIEAEQQKGTIRGDITAAMAAFLVDNLFISLQFSYASEYYRQRARLYLGTDIEERDRFVREQLVTFIVSALKA